MTDISLTEDELLRWFEKDLLPKIIIENRFPIPDADPKNIVLDNLKYESTAKGTDHFASTPYYTKLTVKDSTDLTRSKDYYLIVKFITQNVAARGAMEYDVQFYNEMVFYNEVLPAFQSFLDDHPGASSNYLKDVCPVCRYTHIDLDSPSYGIVIMDDLREEGFATAKSKVELTIDYCLAAVKKLAKFHALSYAMKLEKNPVFDKITSLFRECRYQEDDYKTVSMGTLHEITGQRAIDYLTARPELGVPKSYLDMLREKFVNDSYNMMRELISPKEPIAVVIHGDFCRNNILFQLKDGKCVDAKLFDYQTWRYSNPSIDLTFFIYMNTTLDLREKHFDEILTAYHTSLINNVSAITSKPLSAITELLPFETFEKDFGDHSVYGYAISAFFLPMMMVPKENPADFEDEWSSKTFNEMAEENAQWGGEVVTQRIAEIIIHLYKRKFLL